jgi:hypothetical protein
MNTIHRLCVDVTGSKEDLLSITQSVEQLRPDENCYFSVPSADDIQYIEDHVIFSHNNGDISIIICTEKLSLRDAFNTILQSSNCSDFSITDEKILDFDALSQPLPEREADNGEIFTKAPAVFR